MATDPQAVAAAMEVLGCERGVGPYCLLHPRRQLWTDAGCPVAVAVVERLTPTIAARALEDAADHLDGFLSGYTRESPHSRAGRDIIARLRDRAAEIRNQPKETP